MMPILRPENGAHLKFSWFLKSVVRLKWALMSVARMEPMTTFLISCMDNLWAQYGMQSHRILQWYHFAAVSDENLPV